MRFTSITIKHLLIRFLISPHLLSFPPDMTPSLSFLVFILPSIPFLFSSFYSWIPSSLSFTFCISLVYSCSFSFFCHLLSCSFLLSSSLFLSLSLSLFSFSIDRYSLVVLSVALLLSLPVIFQQHHISWKNTHDTLDFYRQKERKVRGEACTVLVVFRQRLFFSSKNSSFVYFDFFWLFLHFSLQTIITVIIFLSLSMILFWLPNFIASSPHLLLLGIFPSDDDARGKTETAMKRRKRMRKERERQERCEREKLLSL